MKKRVFIVLVLAVLVAGGVFAQSWPPAIAGDSALINFGVGLGWTSGLSMGIPPIKLTADFLLPIDVPITLGGMVGIESWSWGSLWGSDYTVYHLGLGARAMFHFNFAKMSRSDFVRKLDTYAGLTLGYAIVFDNADDSYWGGGWGHVNYFLFGIGGGMRYFFTKNVGMYLELGYSAFDIVSLGLSFKF